MWFTSLSPTHSIQEDRIFLLCLQMMMLRQLCLFRNVCVRVLFHQNELVDVCEKMQLQALRIEKFIKQTLTAKEQTLQVRIISFHHPLNHVE